VYEWQEVARRGGLEALRGPGRPRRSRLDGPPLRSALLNDGEAARRRIAELERKIGEQQGDLDFFRQALRHVKARQQAAGVPGAVRSTKSSRR
jgi:transposase